MNHLKFRRQFLFSATECAELKNWDIINLETHFLYTHPDCETARVSNIDLELILIGHILDPRSPDHTTLDILNNISNFVTMDDISEKLYGLVGRFVLIIKKNNSYTFFHDACGLKLIFYTKYQEALYAASQPLLLKLVTDIQEGVKYQEYYASKYIKSKIEHWIPSGTSLYENVYHLVPNHYLDVENYKQVRYWPVKPLKTESFETSLEQFSTLLEKTILAANKKFKLALTLTAGWDSRMLLACFKQIHEDTWFYTLKIRNFTMNHNDLKIPTKLSSKLGLQYKIIDCHVAVDEKFEEIYKNNTDIPHMHDWGEMASAMYAEYPPEQMTVKGNCSEIAAGRSGYKGKSCKIYSSNDFLELEPLWKDLNFIQEGISEWLDEINHKETSFNYNLYDLFYWEHRMGSWQAQAQLEWDIVQDAFTPFNNRELLDIMLRTDPLYRCSAHKCSGDKINILFRKSMEALWPEVLSEPINPLSIKDIVKNVYIRIKNISKSILKKIGIFNQIKALIKR